MVYPIKSHSIPLKHHLDGSRGCPPDLSFSCWWGERSRSSSRINLLDRFPHHPHTLPCWRGDTLKCRGNARWNARWMVGEWGIFKWFKPQHPSTSINVHQHPSISINIHQHPSISINIHQHPSSKWRFSPSKISTWTYYWHPPLCHSTLRAGKCRNYLEVSSWENDLLQAGGDFPLPCLISGG